ncbi:MAG: hypothetical protein NVSMB12_07020 [Acidimicrobiales bacterium]
MSIEIRSTARGDRRYEVRLRDPAGKEYSRTFRTRKEAERFENAQLADRARGTWLDPRTGDVTIEAWAAEWLISNPAKTVVRPPSSETRQSSASISSRCSEVGRSGQSPPETSKLSSRSGPLGPSRRPFADSSTP